MKTKWVQCLTVLIFFPSKSKSGPPKMEKEHDLFNYRPRLSPYITGTDYQIPGVAVTPDYREEEPPFFAHNYEFYLEENRPYRMSPHYIQQYRWDKYTKKNNPDLMGCYCTTVYKRTTPLAGCAVITTRHILTTASTTEMVLSIVNKSSSLQDILGAWYDNNANVWNSSMYMAPARIHYHPKYIRSKDLNVTHPVEAYFDLAVWTATYRFYGSFWSWSKTCICNRGGSHPWAYGSSTPRGELLFIVGFQYIMAWKKKPMPWFKYAVRTRETTNPCPKTEWGWYHCVPGNWAKFGIESGAALHRCFEGYSWRYDGLIGLNTFSMSLRSYALTHYFHPLDVHDVLDFLYSSYMGRLPYEYLDYRFNDTQWGSPRPWKWISHNYHWGVEHYYNNVPFNY